MYTVLIMTSVNLQRLVAFLINRQLNGLAMTQTIMDSDLGKVIHKF